MNIGIVGAGRMGDRHAEAYRRVGAGVNVIGFADINSEKAKFLAAKYGTEWFKSVKELLAKMNLDAVDICTPTTAHTDPCIECLDAGKHVLVEKPLAHTLEDCDKIISKSEKAGVILMVGHICRFMPSHVEAKKVIERGEIGEPIMAIDFAMGPGGLPGKLGMPTWVKFKALGGGSLMDTGVHSIDRLRWWFQSDIESVYTVGIGNYTAEGDADTHDMAVLKFRNGTFATIVVVCPSTGTYENSTQMIGTKGALYVQLGKEIRVGKYAWREVPFPFSAPKTEMYPSHLHNIVGFESELREFIGSILEQRTPAVTGYDGRAAVEGVLAMYQSYETGRPIHLPLK